MITGMAIYGLFGALVIDFKRIFVASRVLFCTCCGGSFSYKNLIGEQYAFT